ncbi:MAG TPA: alkaline phosphatase D family protein [Opitutaceae bacterium]|nr:alkaline phosphatase D family protein [Opitutaceae bacterium]
MLNKNILTRRTFIAGGASLTVAMLAARAVGGNLHEGTFDGYPFTLGVASGDPTHNGFVIWTRLAPHPLEPSGGMPSDSMAVDWEVAEDEGMNHIALRGKAIADFAWAHSIHVEVAGLRPDRWYWYRFRLRGTTSAVGRARTLPAPGTTPERLRFAFASCQKYEVGYYTAYEHLIREDLDLIIFLGDYIYEKTDGDNAVRPHGLPEANTLDTYRTRYAVYKTDPALQAAHAHAPWIVTWDDHEVSNDYANDIPERSDSYSREQFLARRAAAYRAYYEHMPLRNTARPTGSAMQLYRHFGYGHLACFHVLDTRQYRSALLAGGRRQIAGPAMLNPNATMLGSEQREWLFNGLTRSESIWNVLAQQVLMASVDRNPGPELVVDVDKWAGYEYERRAVLRFLEKHKIANPVVLTGDIHSNWAIELQNDFDYPEPRAVAVEFVGTSISSSGDGVANPVYLEALLRDYPSVKFHNSERGYVRCDLTTQEWRTDFLTVPFVSRPGAPLHTRASLHVEAGTSTLHA